MNELYNETVERNGKTYHYNPEHDCYYYRNAPLSTVDRYSWIVVTILMTAVCIYVEFFIK
jgi:hypothetical protein